MVGFGVNSMGAHFNPVSISIVNSESREPHHATYDATKDTLHQAFDYISDCGVVGCKECAQLTMQDASSAYERPGS